MTRRLLLVHAHPDDESIATGATMAKYASEGAHVALVTCTLGEEGEVIPPELAHLAPDRDDALGPYRVGELAAAMKALGVTDHRFLGGPGRWRDSGMMGMPQNDRPDSFWRADLDEATAALVDVIEEVRPQVLVTYDENGFYGHPDHIQAHRVSARAFEMVRRTPYEIAKFYVTAIPRSAADRAFEAVREAVKNADVAFDPPEGPGIGVPDETVTTRIDATEYLPAKLAAMRAHATQISVDPPWFALSNNIAQRAGGVEYYVLRGGAPRGEVETDLFAG